MLNIIYGVVYILLVTLVYCIIPYNATSIKISNKDAIIYFVITYSGSLILYLLNYKFMLLPFYLICIIICFYNFTKRKVYSILLCLFSLFIIMGYEILIEIVMVLIFRLSESKIVSNQKYHLILAAISVFIMYIISKFSSRFFEKIVMKEIYFKMYYKQTILILLSLTSCFFYIWEINYLYDVLKKSRDRFNLISYSFLLGFFILIILLVFSFYRNIKSQFEQKYKELEFAKITEYTGMLETMTNSLTSFKHDYLNILQTLGGFIDTDDISGLKQFYRNELLPESYEVLIKDKSYMRLKYIKISPLKALISSKIISAQSVGITVNIEIIEDIDELSILTIDICRIMGIILDNAIEASSLTEEKNIELAVVKNEKKVAFIVTNSCLEDVPPVYKIYEKNFSTKGKGRGIGLKNVREIVDKKYNNIILNTKIVNLTFKQELNIYTSKHDK